MSKVTFRSKQPYFQLSYMDVFRVGFITVPVVGGKPYKDNGKPNIDYAKCEELGIKDPDSVGSGYLFREGADHNEITLENEDVIEGIRAYIASRNDYLIVELEDGKEPADPEGTVFECKTALYQLYPAIYKGVSTAEGKTFSFNRGEKQNRYITNDAEEIKILRVRERIKNNPEFIEAFCDAEAKALGGGSGEPVEGRDHSKHIEELKRKYGGDEEPEYSEWDRSLISKIKQ